MEIQLKGNKPDNVSRLIFDMLDVLFAVGVPTGGTHRRLERMAMACLAVGGIVDSFERAKSADDGFFLSTREIIAFENEHFDENISPGSYDDIRRKDLLLPVQAGIVVNSSAYNVQATNNPMRGYALNPKFTALLAEYGKPGWEAALSKYQSQVRSLRDELERKRKIERVAVTLPSGVLVELSAGEHNVLQKAIVEEFLPRFGFGAQVLYIGDTTDRSLYVDKAVLIPRQETEELCRLALDSFRTSGNRSHGAGDLQGGGLRILDICTGSGCIAWAMSANLPGAAVFGCDISYPALEVASSQKVGVRCPVFFQNDILSGDFPLTGDFDAILSNPPYVTSSEKRLMSRNVLDYEPHSALFVTDEDPLVFYRALAGMASAHLKPEGFGIVEINEAFGDGCRGLFMDYGFSNSVIIKDLNGKDRFCRFSR